MKSALHNLLALSHILSNLAKAYYWLSLANFI